MLLFCELSFFFSSFFLAVRCIIMNTHLKKSFEKESRDSLFQLIMMKCSYDRWKIYLCITQWFNSVCCDLLMQLFSSSLMMAIVTSWSKWNKIKYKCIINNNHLHSSFPLSLCLSSIDLSKHQFIHSVLGVFAMCFLSARVMKLFCSFDLPFLDHLII